MHNGSSLVQRKVDSTQNICDIKGMNDEAENLSRKSEHPNPFTEYWLKNASDVYRKKLLIQRLLMNIGLKEVWPLDVDAIEITDSQIIFHEFKRKTPCPGGCFLIVGKHVTKSLLLNILQSCRNSNMAYGEALFRYVDENLQYQRDETAHCYGLDLSHLTNFEYCNKNNISYVHTIWDSSDYPEKPNIEQLFNESGIPANGVTLISKQLEVSDFIGFIFTAGNNSGSFNKNLRLQAVISGDEFDDTTCIPIPISR